MPLYDYQCTFCQKTTEILQKVDAPAETICPYCQKEGLVKQLSSPQFHLKGTGWYVTDFKNKPKAPEIKTETKSDTQKTEEKSDTNVTETTSISKSDEKKSD